MKRDRNLLPIGEVSKSFGVSDNTIRRMEAAGLITPALVNESSGYRYYDNDNIAAISNVMNLKAFGFTYAEIRQGLNEPGGMQGLYDKLVAKRAGIDLMITKLGRRIPSHGSFRVEETSTPDTYSYVLEDKIAPTVRAATGLVRRAVFEAVRRRCPVDFSLPVVLTCEFDSLREVVAKRAVSVTACVPLRSDFKEPDVKLLPGIKAASFTFDREFGTVDEALDRIDAEVESRGFKQNGPVRAIIDAADKRSETRTAGSSTIHVLLPIE